MMDLEKSFNEQEFDINETKGIIRLLQLAVENRWVQDEILKNQVRILEHLKTGTIDDEVVSDKLKEIDDHLAGVIRKQYFDIIAGITE